MSTISTVRTAIADTLAAAITTAEIHDKVPGHVTTPAIIVQPTRGNVRSMGRGIVELFFDVTVIVAAAEPNEAQDHMDGYLSSSGSDSIMAALHGSDLGLSDASASAMSWSDYSVQDIDDKPRLSATVQVSVSTSGTS